MNRICTRCKQSKPDSEFYHHLSGTRKGKHFQPCKPCNYEKATIWRKANPEIYKESCRKTKASHNHYPVSTRKWLEKNKHRSVAYAKNFKRKNPIRARAWGSVHTKISKAIKKGLIKRPTICEQCQRSGSFIEAAHWDYSKPFQIRWLCRFCHRRWDREQPKTLYLVAA